MATRVGPKRGQQVRKPVEKELSSALDDVTIISVDSASAKKLIK
jgi:hypothetical protein